jgi:hypothetical protein
VGRLESKLKMLTVLELLVKMVNVLTLGHIMGALWIAAQMQRASKNRVWYS